MKLPDHHLAEVDLRKLTDYCLSPYHEEGRHKARVFASALGLEQSDSLWLRDQILLAIAAHDAVEQDVSPYGRRFFVDFELVRHGKTALVRTAWIVRTGEVAPRLTSCFVI